MTYENVRDAATESVWQLRNGEYMKNHWTVCCKRVNFIIYKFYLNKAVFKNSVKIVSLKWDNQLKLTFWSKSSLKCLQETEKYKLKIVS